VSGPVAQCSTSTLHLAAAISLALATASCWARRVYSAIAGRFGLHQPQRASDEVDPYLQKCDVQPGFHALRARIDCVLILCRRAHMPEAMRLSPAHTGREG
jgi:hypothetical protein